MKAKVETGAVIAGVALVVAAGVYYQYRKIKGALSDAHQAGQDAVKPVTDAVWNVYSFIKGAPVMAESPTAAFFLNKKYIKADGLIDATWRRSIELMNEGNAALFNLITDDRGRIKSEYMRLIDGEVSSETVQKMEFAVYRSPTK